MEENDDSPNFVNDIKELIDAYAHFFWWMKEQPMVGVLLILIAIFFVLLVFLIIVFIKSHFFHFH